MISKKDKQKTVRLQVYLSHSGACSRRKAMDFIKDGRVTVDGEIVNEPSFAVHLQKHRVCLNGRPVTLESYDYLLLNKPQGYITTKKDPFAGKTVFDLLPKNFKHLHPVGRLDKNTEGLLLMTNDGELTNKLTHPKFDVEKTYIVKILGRLTVDQKSRLQKGIIIDNKKTAPAKVSKVKESDRASEFCLTIHEGRKRQIRLMLRKLGHHVVFLKRVQQGPISLGTVKLGQFRRLTAKEVQMIKKI